MSENTAEVPVTTTTSAPAAEPGTKKHEKAHKRPSTPFKAGESGFLTKTQRKQVVLVTDEADLLYNPKVKDPPPEHLPLALSKGWKLTNPLTILPDGRIFSGRTKWRVLEKAESLAGEDLEVPYVVVDIDEDAAADATDMLDMQVQRINPMIIAEKILRNLSRGKTEKEIMELTGISVNDQHGYLLLMDEERCPVTVQDMLRNGEISFAGAIELARRAEKMTKGEVEKAAAEMAKAAAGGVRLTAAQVKKAAGVKEGRPATLREKKIAILSLDSAGFKGKHADATKWAAMVALEYGIGTRTEDSFWAALKKIANGGVVKVEFKQYQKAADVKEKDE